jgi:hypothetical protein
MQTFRPLCTARPFVIDPADDNLYALVLDQASGSWLYRTVSPRQWRETTFSQPRDWLAAIPSATISFTEQGQMLWIAIARSSGVDKDCFSSRPVQAVRNPEISGSD